MIKNSGLKVAYVQLSQFCMSGVSTCKLVQPLKVRLDIKKIPHIKKVNVNESKLLFQMVF